MADALAQLEEEILRKREAAADEPADAARDAKRGRVERAAAATRETVNRTLQAADQRGEVEEDALDERSLKHLVLAFEKRVTENVKMRAKFGDQPSKFLDSEIELYAELHKFRVLGTSPELLPTFVSAGCLPTVLGLLAHENLDIVIGVIELLAELTDSDLLTDLPELEQANVLISALVENSAFDVLVDCLGRLNETVAEESEAVHKTLGIIENMLESDPSKLAPLVVAKTAFMPWLLRRVKERAFDANRLYATELLSILLQSQPENQKRLAELDGVDVLLLAASAYKRKGARRAARTATAVARARSHPAPRHARRAHGGVPSRARPGGASRQTRPRRRRPSSRRMCTTASARRYCCRQTRRSSCAPRASS